MATAAPLSDAKRALLEKLFRAEIVAPPPPERPTIPRRAETGAVPLSFGQEQIWLHGRLAPEAPVYNEPITVHRHGPLDATVLERCLTELLRRHASWRTTFHVVNDEPVQVVHAPEDVRLELVDLSGRPDAEARSLALQDEDGRRPFDLAQAPPVRFRLVRLAPEEHRLQITLHHIVFDGVSIYQVFLPELITLYDAFSAGRPSPLPAPVLQYTDFADWQRRRLSSGAVEENVAYWRERLAGMPAELALPTDRPRPRMQTFRGSMLPIAFGKELTEAVKALARREGVTPFVALLAAFNVLLSRHSDQDDVVIGGVTSGRTRSETERIVGYFLNTVPLRTDLSGDPPFRELLGRVRETMLGALSHDEVPFERLVNDLAPRRDASRNPLFSVLFSLEPPIAPLPPGWEFTQMDVSTGTAKFDLALELDERPEGIIGRFIYSEELFDRATIEGISSRWRTLLLGIVEDASRRASELPLLGREEIGRALASGGEAGEIAVSAAPLHRLFEKRAARTPEACAIASRSGSITYRELDRRAHRVAHALVRRGVRPGDHVAVLEERSADVVAALLGILKAGAAYVPLDPEDPDARLAAILGASGARLLVASRASTQRVAGAGVPAMTLAEALSGSGGDERAPLPDVSLEDLAYVIHTSGTTGTPKGVLVSHRAIVHHLLARQALYPLAPTDAFLQKASLAFDISVWEIFGTLLSGAKLVLAPHGASRDPAALVRTIQAHRVTTCHFSPQALRVFLEETEVSRCASLRRVFCGGEPLPFELAELFHDRLAAELVSQYGPTEAAVDVTFWTCRRGDGTPGRPVPIGTALPGVGVTVRDRRLGPVPDGVAGEVCISGPTLARGYRNDEAATRAAFVEDPFAPAPGTLLYRTGDRGRRRPDGSLELIGRLDGQVKVRGYRVELGEIESALSRQPSVAEAAVVVREDAPGEKRLVAYVVGRAAKGEAPIAELRSALRALLPEWMIPSAFVTLGEMPRLSSGKLDRKALPDPDRAPRPAGPELAAARDDVERRLVRIWEQVLGVAPIGVDESYFDLGGHSLLAVRLFGRIEKELGERLPLATIFQAPTIAELATLLRQSWKPSWSSLVPIQPYGSRPPFYCVHAIGGNVLTYFDLSRHLGADQPVYGLQAQGLDGRRAPHDSVEAMAAYYIEEIRAFQPEGPYYLGGSSAGGRVAFEMAQQLVAAGHEVGLLALFDTWGPDYRPDPSVSPLELKVTSFAKRVDLHLGNFLVAEGAKGKLDYIATKSKRVRNDVVKVVKRTLKKLRPLPRALRNVESTARRASERYVFRPYPGRVTIFRATKQPSGYIPDRTLGWSGMAGGGVEVHDVPGYHGAIVYEPRVGVLARNLRECLDEATESASRARPPRTARPTR